jgi:hypothetical protein
MTYTELVDTYKNCVGVRGIRLLARVDVLGDKIVAQGTKLLYNVPVGEVAFADTIKRGGAPQDCRW